MIPICYICLRNDRKLRLLMGDLKVFYDEFNDITEGMTLSFCSVCMYQLQKCYDFKVTCNRALQKYIQWSMQNVSTRLPVNLMHHLLPPSSLGLADSYNFKVYLFQEQDLSTTATDDDFKSDNYIVPDDINEVDVKDGPFTVEKVIKEELMDIEEAIVQIKDEPKDVNTTVNLEQDAASLAGTIPGLIDGPATELKADTILGLVEGTVHNLEERTVDIVDDVSTEYLNKMSTAIEQQANELTNSSESTKEWDDVDMENDEDDSNDLLVELNVQHYPVIEVSPLKVNSRDINTETEKTYRKEIVSKDAKSVILKRPNLVDDDRSKTVKRKNVEALKKLLKAKWDQMGEVKDDKGNTVDMEKVFANLNLMNNRITKDIRRFCEDSGPLSSSAIRKLADVQAAFLEETMFNITHFKNEQEMRDNHERRRQFPSYKAAKHKCEKCVLKFKSQSMVEHHIKMAHDDSLPYECAICERRYKTRHKTMSHIHVSHVKLYQCKLCPDFIATDRQYVMVHYGKHKGIKHQCEHCGLYFNNKNWLYGHLMSKHPAQHICWFCAKAFTREGGLKLHLIIKHHNAEFQESDQNKKCVYCDAIFISNDVYLKHLELTHKLTEDGQTIQDPKPRTRKNNDEKIERRPRIYRCLYCVFNTSSLYERQKHYTESHLEEYKAQMKVKKNYLCDDCGKGFQHLSQFKVHMVTHSQTKEHQCPHCPKKFRSEMHLNNHIPWHLPPTKKCNYCGKMFKASTNLNTHIKSHLQNRCYKCDLCPKGFITNSLLQEHIRGVHLKIRRDRRDRRTKKKIKKEKV